MILRGNIKRLTLFTAAAFFVLAISASAFGQTLYDSFSDGNFTSNPMWGGTTASWTVVANSDVAAGATGSQTVRLNATTAGTSYLSSQIPVFSTSQEWGVFIGRRAQPFTLANQQYFWLYANEADLTSTTVDGYRLAIGDNTGVGDEIRLEYIVNGSVSATVITSTDSIMNNLTDIGFLIRVTRSVTGTFQIFTSVLPTANGTGAIATDIPNPANTPVNQGTGTNNAVVPANNGYIGLAALYTDGVAAALATAEFDQVYFTPLGTSAAGATVGGRVTFLSGRGIFRAVVTMTDSQGDVQTAYTDQSGFFNFTNVPGGETYIFTVSHRRYQFAQSSQVQFIGEDNPGINFTASGGSVFSGSMMW